MLRRLRLAVGLLSLWPEIAGCGGSAIADSGGTGGTMSTGGLGSAGAGGSAATGGLASANGGVTGGSAGTDGEALCSNVTPCGGDVVGTWTVTSSCLTVIGDLDLSYMGLGYCDSASVTGSLDVTGTWTATSDGTYSDDTHTTGSHHLELGEECREFDATAIACDLLGSVISGYLGYADGSCADNLATGGCTCEAVIDQPGPYGQTGGIGFAPNGGMALADSYTTADDVLSIGEATYSYCISGTRLRLTPVSDPLRTGTLVGSVALQMQ